MWWFFKIMLFLILAGKNLKAQIRNMPCAQAYLLLLVFPFQMCCSCAWGIPLTKALSQGGKWGSPRAAHYSAAAGCWPAANQTCVMCQMYGTVTRQKHSHFRNRMPNSNKVKRYRWKMAPDFPDLMCDSAKQVSYWNQRSYIKSDMYK